MNKALVTLSILAAFMVGVSIGTFYPIAVNEQPPINTYLKDNDQGCNDIKRDDSGRLICEVSMTAEDDAIYIINKEGVYDDYK